MAAAAGARWPAKTGYRPIGQINRVSVTMLVVAFGCRAGFGDDLPTWLAVACKNASKQNLRKTGHRLVLNLMGCRIVLLPDLQRSSGLVMTEKGKRD
jgi:hypothetical protein